MRHMGERARLFVVLVLAIALVAVVAHLDPGPAVEAAPLGGITNFDSVTLDSDLVVGDDATITDDLTVSSSATVADDLTVTDDLAVTGLINAQPNEEHIGLASVLSTTITYESSGGLWTIADGEIWIIHAVLIEVTTNFDCTGNDCAVKIGDGTDDNGLLDLVDAELQAADTEVTGGAAGWQGQLSGTLGAYLADGWFVYAPSGSAETIDVTVEGTSPAAGAATVYIVYTRIR